MSKQAAENPLEANLGKIDDAALGRVNKLLFLWGNGNEWEQQAARELSYALNAHGAETEPIILAGRSEVARWLSRHVGFEIKPRLISDMRHRFPPDRDEAAVTRTPPIPAPDFIIEEDGGRETFAWLQSRRTDWTTWWDNRPGQGVGGGAPRLTPKPEFRTLEEAKAVIAKLRAEAAEIAQVRAEAAAERNKIMNES